MWRLTLRNLLGGDRLGVALLALLIAVAGLTVAFEAFRSEREPLSTPSSTVSNGRIAFALLAGGRWQIDTINPDGTSKVTLTDVPGSAFHPAWSPDGHRLLVDVRFSGGRMQIFVLNDDGTGLTQLTDGPGWNYLPAWSSDGARIAFASTRDGNDEIYVMNADGTAQMRLTDSPDEDVHPLWAPGGDRIAFQSNRGGSNEIYVMDPDGSDVTRLTNDPGGFNGAPAWSPDGEHIAFAGDLDGPGLYTMNKDGTDIVRLTHDSEFGSLDPAWSPDGTSIVNTASVTGSNKLGIFLVDVNTLSRQALPGVSGDVCCPSWQPLPNNVTDVPSASPPATMSSVGGIQVEVPPGWLVAQENLTPWLSQPTEVLSVGTFEMPVSRDPGDELRVSDAPVAPAALAAMTATDAFVSVEASGHTDAPDDRPPSFRTAKDRACCSAQTGDYPFNWWWIPYIDQGRAFYLFVAIGNQADSNTSDQAWAIADSLVVVADDGETATASSPGYP